MTVDTFGFKLAYISGLYGAPILAVSIDVRNIASVCSLPGGLPGWSAVMRTKRPLIIWIRHSLQASIASTQTCSLYMYFTSI